MNGPAHYVEAERYLQLGLDMYGQLTDLHEGDPTATADFIIACAELMFAAGNAHATLAHVAATQQSGSTWQEVL